MKISFPLIAFCCCTITGHAQNNKSSLIHPLNLKDVRVQDSFWSPRYRLWSSVTVYDVLDKLEGKYIPDRPDMIKEQQKTGRTSNALHNFDLVAQGKTNINTHDGPPWYDGLLYETIRGAADLLVQHPDAKLEKKIDGYINRIAAAQAADPDGYINTYTTLTRPGKRWGTNGGDDKWQHDIYNAGMLTEAAVHYYYATGKTKLLAVAVKMCNYMCKEIGVAPKKNVVPGHGGPEEALIKLYRLLKEQPALKTTLNTAVDEQQYYDLATYFIEYRGNYGESDGSHSRKSDSSYNQDHEPVFQQQTIEGHAVRATLLATGVATVAVDKNDPPYITTANNYWNNMIGKRMFITGGQGAIAEGERFGKDYYLPESAYLETCASIGAAFFSEKMNELQADGKYMDEFERVLYNNLLSGISLTGNQYHYENPLIATSHPRWNWHGCPCCPPMILKMAGALPQYIYGYNKDAVFVNLFIGSTASVPLPGNKVQIRQLAQYPWQGNIELQVNPQKTGSFTVKLRIPGWAQSKENPFDLYYSTTNTPVTISVNGNPVDLQVQSGYASIIRSWKKGDRITLVLPTEPRIVRPANNIETLKGKVAIAAGPIVYGFEATDNPLLNDYTLAANPPFATQYKPGLLNNINVIEGKATTTNGGQVNFTAIPFYSIGNRNAETAYKVWLPAKV